MSTGNAWQWLIDHCLKAKERFLPGADGEPWVPYTVVAELLQQEAGTISKAVTKHGIPRHPVFSGLVKISSFERVSSDDGDNRKRSTGL